MTKEEQKALHDELAISFADSQFDQGFNYGLRDEIYYPYDENGEPSQKGKRYYYEEEGLYENGLMVLDSPNHQDNQEWYEGYNEAVLKVREIRSTGEGNVTKSEKTQEEKDIEFRQKCYDKAEKSFPRPAIHGGVAGAGADPVPIGEVIKRAAALEMYFRKGAILTEETGK